MIVRIFTVVAAVAIAVPTSARADDMQARVLAAAKATRPDAFAFQSTITTEQTGSTRAVWVQRYDPRRVDADRWTLISEDGKPPSAKSIEAFRKVQRPVPSYARVADWFGTPATRTEVAPGYVNYHFASLPAGVIKIESHDASADTQADALVNMKGPVPFVERARFVSTKGFRMMLVASVKSIEIVRRYRLLSTGGIVPDTKTELLNGSMLGKSGQKKTEVTYQDMRAVR